MLESREIRKLRNALLLIGLGALIAGLFALGSLPTKVEEVVGDPGLGGEFNSHSEGTQIAEDRTGMKDKNEVIVATNTSLPTLLAAQTPYQFLYNDKGDRIPVTWGNYPGPSTWPSTPVPAPIGILPKPDGQINILVLGNDYRPKRGARTDAIMLLTLNPGTGTASITSFPRDLYVYAPAWSILKLNTVQPRGGYQLLMDTFEYNFGVRPDHYMNISMTNFETIIDSLGGINVRVYKGLSDATFAGGKFAVQPGMVPMNGQMALWYSRSRETTGDIDRSQRQQEVLKAVFIKIMSMDAVTRAPEFYERYIDYVATDLQLADLLSIAPLAVQLLDVSRISQYSIGENETTVWITPKDKAWVLLPDSEAVRLVMLAAVAP